MPSVDPSKVVYYSEFNAYKNEKVYDATISVTGGSISGGAFFEFATTISVPETSDYITAQVQANESVGSPPQTPSALRWQDFPSALIVSIDLTTDPTGSGTLDCSLVVRISGDEVTFSVAGFNPYANPVAFTPTNIGVRYAVHTTEG